MHQYLVLHVSEMNPREDIFDECIEPGAISKRQLGHGVQSQCLNHQTTLLDCMYVRNSDLMSIPLVHAIGKQKYLNKSMTHKARVQKTAGRQAERKETHIHVNVILSSCCYFAVKHEQL